MIFRTWDLSFGTYMVWVSRTQTWKFFGHDFQDVRSSVFGDLEFALGVSKTQDLGNFRIWFSGRGTQLWVLDFHTRGFQDRNLRNFRTWFSGRGTSILEPGFQTGGFAWSRTWNFLAHGFQDVESHIWDLDFTLIVSKTQTWKILGHDFQDMGSHFLGPEFLKLGGSVTQDLEILGPGFHIRGFQDPNLETLRTWFSRRGTSVLGSGFSHWGWFPWPRTWKFFRTWFSRRGIPSLGPGFHIRGFQTSKPGNS
jgi:hypothetical protein